MKKDVYDRITAAIVADLQKRVRPWLKPWSSGNASRPLRANGIPFRGINVLMLWSAAMEKGYAAPIWMTFKQALELDAHVRKGEQGSLVVDASTFSRSETDQAHNANLVVNTDADQIIVASVGPYTKGTLPPITYLSGGLESQRIRKAVCDILEGGEHAFRERARRLRVRLER